MEESKFQFKNPELIKLSFDINDNFDEKTFDGIAISSNTTIKQSDSENIANVTLSLNIGDDNNASPFRINIVMESDFLWSTTFDDDTVQNLLRTNAPSFLLSYMRPLIASITSNSKYPAFNLPFIDMSQNKLDE